MTLTDICRAVIQAIADDLRPGELPWLNSLIEAHG